MNMRQLIDKYVLYRQSLGEKFESNERVLSAYGRFAGESVKPASVTSYQIQGFVDGIGPVTNARRKRYDALKGFYQYATSRGFLASNPMPTEVPKWVPSQTPYIYGREEIQRLLKSPMTYRYRRLAQPITTQTVLLLLYGTGLRIREAISLDDDDVDLEQSVITVRNTKFYKSRLVPFGCHLKNALEKYLKQKTKPLLSTEERPFFTSRTGERLNQRTFTNLFRSLCNHVNIQRDGATYQPRLHDLRHTFAVHRLTSWYEQGADVQRLLPKLSAYLGHVNISGTQVYLSMTPELLRSAGQRFEQYADTEAVHV